MIRFILLFLLFMIFYYALKFIINFIIPILRGQSQSPSSSKKEGEVTIEYQPDKNKKYNKSEGEYVDYIDVD